MIREGAQGFSVLVRHSYGRLEWLARPGPGSLRLDEAVGAVAREVLRVAPDADLHREIRRLLAGRGPRWEIREEEVRAAASRAGLGAGRVGRVGSIEPAARAGLLPSAMLEAPLPPAVSPVVVP